MLILLLIGVFALYICIRREWVLLILAPVLYMTVDTKKSTNIMSYEACERITPVAQNRYPVCWLMSTVGLLKNIQNVHKIDIWNHDVQELIQNWTSAMNTRDRQDTSCPLISPKSLRDHLFDIQLALDKFTVTITRDPVRNAELMQSPHTLGCMQAETQNTETEEPVPHYAAPTDQTRLFSKFTWGRVDDFFPPNSNTITFNANYDSPIISDFLSGKRYWYQYPVCVKKFIPYYAFNFLDRLLSYGSKLIKVTQSRSTKSNVFESSSFYFKYIMEKQNTRVSGTFLALPREDSYAKMNDKPTLINYLVVDDGSRGLGAFLLNLHPRAVSRRNHKVLGGIVLVANENTGHVMHFVTCGNTVVFVDSNESISGRVPQIHNSWDVVRVWVREYQMQPKAACLLILRTPT